MNRQDFQRTIKRAFDLIASLLTLVLLSPQSGRHRQPRHR
jgi:hypothetical protein